jgi:hypothetical protein
MMSTLDSHQSTNPSLLFPAFPLRCGRLLWPTGSDSSRYLDGASAGSNGRDRKTWSNHGGQDLWDGTKKGGVVLVVSYLE